MWGRGTNVIRQDQTTNFEMKLDYGYTTARVIQYFPKHVEENLRNVHSPHLTNECRQLTTILYLLDIRVFYIGTTHANSLCCRITS
jgi:hypothetical protein